MYVQISSQMELRGGGGGGGIKWMTKYNLNNYHLKAILFK